jgi:hypothetical protein
MRSGCPDVLRRHQPAGLAEGVATRRRSGRDFGTAYQQQVDGYSCTVQDHVARGTARGDSLLVFVRALETGGVIQDYEFSYVVRHGMLGQPRMLGNTGCGHAPQGCGLLRSAQALMSCRHCTSPYLTGRS